MLLTASARQVLPWCWLVGCSLVAASRVQAVAASMLATVPVQDIARSTGEHNDHFAQDVQDAQVVVMLTIRNPTNGNSVHLRCQAKRDRVGSEALVIDADSAGAVLPSPCESVWLLPEPYE